MLEFMKSLITLKIMTALYLPTLSEQVRLIMKKKQLIHGIKLKYKEILASDESIFI